MLKVKNLVILIALIGLFFSCTSKDHNTGISPGIFTPLEKEAAINSWGLNNEEKADIFEQIYFEYYREKNFEQILMDYLDNQHKCYWIGIYVDDDFYTEIAKPELSLEILKKGLTMTQSDQEKVRFLWVIGKKYYYLDDKTAAGEYLAEAYKLSNEYPGNTPTWDSEQEYDEIMAFIKESQ